jgi:hypothetical protein
VGLKLGKSLGVNKSLHQLILRDNTLGENSGHQFLQNVKYHPWIKKLDLANNLVNLKYIIKIKVYLQINQNKVDTSLLPNLKKELRDQSNKIKDFGQEVQTINVKIEKDKKKFLAEFKDCDNIIAEFDETYDQLTFKYSKMEAKLDQKKLEYDKLLPQLNDLNKE